MTEAVSYIPNEKNFQNILSLIRKKYSSQKNFDFFLNNFIVSYKFCLDNKNIIFKPFAIYEDDVFIAHIALIIDKRLNNSEAFFGFMELENNNLFDLLWNKLLQESRKYKINLLKGPVNGSIWHQYRCIKETDGSEFFKNELFSDNSYYNYLISKKPHSEHTYHSGYRKNISNILNILYNIKKKYPKDFSIKILKNVSLKELKDIAKISKKVFSNSWGYVELNENEFFNLYSLDNLNKNINKLYVLYYKNNIIGFLSTLRDGADTLICKTVCILPEFQGLGLGNLMAYYLHKDAKEEGIKKIIYALIRDENNIRNFPKDDVFFFRRYAVFDFKLL